MGRGAGYGPRDYAGEADVVCNEGWIRVPNKCSGGAGGDGMDGVENTLEYELKGFWKFDSNTLDMSPHCLDSRTDTSMGSCNDGEFSGAAGTAHWVDGVGETAGIMFNGIDEYVEVHDENNPNWGAWKGDNE